MTFDRETEKPYNKASFQHISESKNARRGPGENGRSLKGFPSRRCSVREGEYPMDKWDHRFMQMAHVIAGWTSCFMPGRSIGCVIVKDKRIMTTGYNGAPAGLKTCRERGECMRRKLNIESGTRAELCYAIHAEQNAIIQAAKLGVSIDGATLYCTHQPCSVCAKMIINAGIARIVYQEGYPDEFSLQIFQEAGVRLEQYAPAPGGAEG